jgi:Protein of unknown function (DUF3102)
MSGLRTPIMLSHDGKQLIDGRNRLAACELAKIEPTFAKLAADQDPVAYIYSFNIMHRFLNKGQRAMAMAMLYPDHGERGRGKKSAAIKSVETTGISRSRLDQARSVLRFSRPIAQAVLNGTTPLDAALAKVKEQEQYQQSDEAKLTRLQTAAPDLAEQVNEERLKINEAIAALQAREAKAKLKHGQWYPWLETEFGWSAVTAWRFMNVFKQIKLSTVNNLEIDVSALYLIAAPKTPEPVRKEIIERAHHVTNVGPFPISTVRHRSNRQSTRSTP